MANHAQTIEARVTLITLMLREDHQKGRQLFDQFDESTNQNEKRRLSQPWRSTQHSRSS